MPPGQRLPPSGRSRLQPMSEFQLTSDFQPTGDQPRAISELMANIDSGISQQVLLGVTGSGKTFTMANVIAAMGKPTIVVAPNKTLAAQLYTEFRAFFPHKRRRILRQLLRLLSARGLYPTYGHLHRERRLHQ